MQHVRIKTIQSQLIHTLGAIRIDWLYAGLTLALMGVGLIILYSAAYEHHQILYKQMLRMLLGLALFFGISQLHPKVIQRWSPACFLLVLALLIAVMFVGHTGKGAQRWLNLGFMRFQPSELLKLSVPMLLAWYFANQALPPKFGPLTIGLCILAVPVLLVAKQPDLGTAVVVLASGLTVIILTGLPWSWLLGAVMATLATLPLLWQHMHAYQRDRVLIFLNPERDPLGAGYHIIQSKIAIGSGGLWGKGWLHGTQTHLQFLPEHKTDFIFSVFGEEFGLFGSCFLILLVLCVVFKGMQTAKQAQDVFTKLLACSLTVTFFISVLVNLGMVSGLLPVVGLPLPLISYGGSASLVMTLLLGILMGIATHQNRPTH